ncbi:NAD(+)/NADH kinase [Candidatus Poriferisodalis sp.]|uniref:NAD(+)/NADH kinase n=1 Tax=Candidatus Poriferisodalis sp. TaxID=3101277 RepID=UPI003D0FFCC5
MSDVAVLAHVERAEALAAAKHLIEWLERNGHSVVLPPGEAAVLGRTELSDDDQLVNGRAALAVSIGGDGTMLRSFDMVAAAGVPVLGVNVGHLGYLTEFEPPHLIETVAAALAGDLGISERMMVSANVQRAGDRDAGRRAGESDAARGAGDGTDEVSMWTGLNEVVVERRDPGHTIRLEVSFDGDVFATYAADGLIVSTPTGSTAYSLSAGGAVVAPTHEALQVTPVAPHMLFDRSLLLPAETEIGLRVIGERTALAAVDGRSATRLHTGDELIVTRAPYQARLVTAGADSFHRVLKHKFGLKDR